MISKTMRAILHTLSYGNIEVESSRRLVDIKKLDAMNIFLKKMDIQIFNGDYEIPLRIYFPTQEFLLFLSNYTCLRNYYKIQFFVLYLIVLYHFPVLLFFHGGGWVTESVDTYNRVCARMSQSTGHIVVSVEYRLAPEYRFPTALMDCYAAAKALYTNKLILNTDPRKITIMGDSAGGNLAAAVALMARDNGEFQVYRQILIYPALYNTYTAASPYASVQKNGTDYLLTAVKMQDYLNLYESCPEDRVNPYFAPLLAKDFSNMPETLILTAEFDPLRDEGEDYGKKLAEAGNYVEVHRIKDALHGFFALGIRFFHVQESFSYMNEFLKREV